MVCEPGLQNNVVLCFLERLVGLRRRVKQLKRTEDTVTAVA